MIELPSGVILTVTPAPFADAKALYQALLADLREVSIAGSSGFSDMMKEIFCRGFSSPRVEATLTKCFERCLYGDRKIDKDTFEPSEARGDYVRVCTEVVRVNVEPFMKGLYAEFLRLPVAIAESAQA